MASHDAIANVSTMLCGLLHRGLAAAGLDAAVVAEPPPAQTGSAARLSLSLYQVTREGMTRDLPQRVTGAVALGPPSVTLRLRYLITAPCADALDAQRLLSRALLVIHGQPILSPALTPEFANSAGAGLRLHLIDLELEEHRRICGVDGPLRPALALEIGPVVLALTDPQRPPAVR